MSDGEGTPPPDQDPDGIPLFEGWMFGRLLFPLAMQEVERVPAANDDEEP